MQVCIHIFMESQYKSTEKGLSKMSAIKLQENIYSVGVLNPSLRVFDIVMESRYGTSYNAYLLTGEKNVLIDTVHPDYFDEYLSNIESVIDVQKIDYLIMNHTEPDHSGSIGKLLEKNPNIMVFGTLAAKKFISAIINKEFACTVVKNGDTLDIGSQTLEFIVAPLLHWPDSMFTWAPLSKALFTCDFLGAHFCEPTMLDSKTHYEKQYWEQFQYYYGGIFGPFKPYVLAGLDKIKDLPIEIVCPSHGPCLTKNIKKCQELYREWSTPVQHEKKIAAVLYASAYGCTAKLAQAAYEELSKNSELDVRLVDVVFTPLTEVITLANEADALFMGSCTINKDAPKVVWDVLCSIDAINVKQKPAGAFGSFGWSGEAVDMIKSRMQHLRYDFVGDGVKANFMPDEEDIAKMKAYALEVAAKIK